MSKIKSALTNLYDRLKKEGRQELPLNKDTRYIILSDQHKGAKNRADDFRQNHPVYNAALKSYFERGYTLVILGDGEELWQEPPRRIFPSYPTTYELEANFYKEGRYVHIWGNHDIEWKEPAAFAGKVKKYLGRDLFKDLVVKEGVLFEVKEKDKVLGEMVLTHGHQGTLTSDTLIFISRPFVRWVWRPIQRFFGVTYTSPATDYELRRKHDRTMYEWAAGRDTFILITGHTHRPVFSSRTHVGDLIEDLANLEKDLEKDPNDKKLQEEIIEKKAEIEYRKVKDTADTLQPSMDKPAYFNTGCCSYPDSDITGIEICHEKRIKDEPAGVYIKLIRWSAKSGTPQCKILRKALLKDVYGEL